MKYAELRWQAAIARAEAKQLRKRHDEAWHMLHNEWVRGKPCEHVTVRKPWWPCPHPSCTGHLGEVMVVMAPVPSPAVSYVSGPLDEVLEPPPTVRLRRSRLSTGEGVIWGWRET